VPCAWCSGLPLLAAVAGASCSRPRRPYRHPRLLERRVHTSFFFSPDGAMYFSICGSCLVCCSSRAVLSSLFSPSLLCLSFPSGSRLPLPPRSLSPLLSFPAPSPLSALLVVNDGSCHRRPHSPLCQLFCRSGILRISSDTGRYALPWFPYGILHLGA
jgi:hypothetical protein